MTKASTTKSYTSILKTTGLIGVVQIIGIVLGIFRTKAIAILLGTAGFGVFSLYNSLIEFISGTSQFGVGAGGVRQLAYAKGNNESEIQKIVFVLKTWVISASSVVVLLMILLSRKVSLFQFNDVQHTTGIIILSFAVLFGNIYNINIIILNGVREIKSMAQTQILASLWGVVVALPILYFFKTKGLELSILAVFIVNSIVSTLFVHKKRIRSKRPDRNEFRVHFKAIFSTGISYAIPTIVGTGMFYIARYYLKEVFNFEILGVYQACITLSTLYVQTILNAMGVDFLPALMSVKDDNQQINKKVTEQMELGLLMASIGVFATLIYAPYILRVFYSKDFVEGASILRWQVLAVFLKVMEWPLGYTTTAKGKNLLYLTLQVSYLLFEFCILYLFTHLWGFKGLGASYFTAYIIFFVVRLISVREITGFTITPLLNKIIRVVTLAVVLTSLCLWLFNSLIATIITSLILVIYTYWAYNMLKREMEVDLVAVVKRKVSKWENK
jgi:Membrane protein involved in the export of O-antigen and teichoic acid